KKTVCGGCGKICRSLYDKRWRRAHDLRCGDHEVYLDFEMRRVACAACGVKNEKLAFLSSNTKFTLRFATQIGGLCRVMTIQDVARLMHLDWEAVKELDKIYMREQLRVAGHPKPRVIGVDEISIKKGHSYRIVVSDLVWRHGSHGSRHGFVLCLSRRAKQPENQACGDGHVEAISCFDAASRAKGRDPVRQVPRGQTSWRRARRDSQIGIQARHRRGSKLHQRPALRAVVAARKPDR